VTAKVSWQTRPAA